jgi:hypothetical protein
MARAKSQGIDLHTLVWRKGEMARTTFLGRIVTDRDIITATKRYDQQYPVTNDYDGWLNNGRYKWALRRRGRLYPPKLILSRVSGKYVGDFSGGDQANRVFDDLGFLIIRKP